LGVLVRLSMWTKLHVVERHPYITWIVGNGRVTCERGAANAANRVEARTAAGERRKFWPAWEFGRAYAEMEAKFISTMISRRVLAIGGRLSFAREVPRGVSHV
jgi:hypothetical protein